ncbi:MAG: nitroreductase family protein [Thermoplasmatota archaeon]
MEVGEAIRTRRSQRALASVEITDEIMDKLMEAGELAPSCMNNQPWRYVFIRSPDRLKEIHRAFNRGNYWAERASLVIVIFSKADHDCMIGDRIYYGFDTGLSASLIMLRAHDLGLVAHPFAGYKPEIAREILDIPEDMTIVAMIGIGRHADNPREILKEHHWEDEEVRPVRADRDQIFFIDRVM